jgi:hypothetical protein
MNLKIHLATDFFLFWELFVPWNVLYWELFVPWDVLFWELFVPWDVLFWGPFAEFLVLVLCNSAAGQPTLLQYTDIYSTL